LQQLQLLQDPEKIVVWRATIPLHQVSPGHKRFPAVPPQPDRRVYLLRLLSGADIRPLRTALKLLKRRFGLVCLSIKEANQ
jgi:hypothetical protein